MTKPNIQIDDEIREMTDEEYQELVDSGWSQSMDEDVSDGN